jgi:hypothetical protein
VGLPTGEVSEWGKCKWDLHCCNQIAPSLLIASAKEGAQQDRREGIENGKEGRDIGIV